MDFHWSIPFLICALVVMFLSSYAQMMPEAFRNWWHTTTAFKEPFANFKKCDRKPPTGVLKDVLDARDYTKTTSDDWDIFLPCTYTHVEQELREMDTQKSLLHTSTPKAVFAVDGCDKLVSKNKLWQALVDVYGRERASTISPSTYVVADPDDLARFLEDYVPRRMYICKKNVQRKKGLMMSDNLDTLLRCHYQGYKVIQEYITDVHLVKGYKLNLRMYVLVVCDTYGNKRVHIHPEGKCLYTEQPYNPDTLHDTSTQITSTASASVYEGKDALPLTLDDLREHWLNVHVDYDTVMRNVHQQLYAAVNAVLPKLCSSTKFRNVTRFQLFGADVLLRGRDMAPFVLEFNKGPSMKPVNDRDYAMKRRVLEWVVQKKD